MAFLDGNQLHADNSKDALGLRTGFSVTVADSFSVSAGPGGVSCDAADTYYSDVWSTDRHYKLTGFTATVADSFAFTNPRSMTWDGANVITGNANTKTSLLTGFTATVADSFVHLVSVYGSGWDGANLTLVENTGTDNVLLFNGFNATVVDSFADNSADNTTNDGTDLIHNEGAATDDIYKRNGFSSTLLDSINSWGTNDSGLDWDDMAARHGSAFGGGGGGGGGPDRAALFMPLLKAG